MNAPILFHIGPNVSPIFFAYPGNSFNQKLASAGSDFTLFIAAICIFSLLNRGGKDRIVWLSKRTRVSNAFLSMCSIR